MLEKFSMGSYGLYVWFSYGLVLLILIIQAFIVKRERIKTKQWLKEWFERTDESL